MIHLQNIEGGIYNPILDNYLVVEVINYFDTAFTDLQRLVDAIAISHNDLIMVECDSKGLEIFEFLEDVSKLVVYKVIQSSWNRYYLTVQKNVLY